jgi:uncharacterized protein YlxW (UPF0749 family)
MTDTRERKEIEAAIQRLLEGTPLRSTGELTVVQLAAEAGVKRWKLTHGHVDLMRSFQAAVRQADTQSPVIAPWRARVASLEADNGSLRQRNTDLQATIQAYAEVIADLSRAIELSPAPALASVRPLR